MSLWICPDHGLTGPTGCCAKASIAYIVSPREDAQQWLANAGPHLLGDAPGKPPANPTLAAKVAAVRTAKAKLSKLCDEALDDMEQSGLAQAHNIIAPALLDLLAYLDGSRE